MNISEDLKNKIIEKINNLRSKNFISNIYDQCLGKKYIDNNGKPTLELVFLSFEEMEQVINNFFKRFYLLHNANCLIYQHILEKYFKYPKKNPKTTLEVLIKQEKERFFQKFKIMYEFIRNEFGLELQKNNEIYICPYCERNYINALEIENKSIKPDLDHYYPKALYPFLACSIENLIPACQVCNSRLKGDKDFYKIKHVNPLKKRVFNNLSFNYNEAGIYIENNLTLSLNEKQYLDTFKIQEIYSTHTEIKDDIKIKFDKYNKIKRKHLNNCCPSLSENEIWEMAFYEYKEENIKHPLRKLKKDLFEKMKKENETT